MAGHAGDAWRCSAHSGRCRRPRAQSLGRSRVARRMNDRLRDASYPPSYCIRSHPGVRRVVWGRSAATQSASTRPLRSCFRAESETPSPLLSSPPPLVLSAHTAALHSARVAVVAACPSLGSSPPSSSPSLLPFPFLPPSLLSHAVVPSLPPALHPACACPPPALPSAALPILPLHCVLRWRCPLHHHD